MDEILHGSRVLAFDPRLFVDDKSTPLSHTMRLATVICRYGRWITYSGDDGPCRYPDLVDI